MPVRRLQAQPRGRGRTEAASPPGAASENSSNDVKEVKGGGWGCGCGGRPNPKLEGSVTKTIAWSRPLIFLPFQPGAGAPASGLLGPPRAGFPSCGGSCHRRVRSRGARDARSPATATPGKHWGAADGGSWWKSAWRCFREGPGFAGHHGNPGAPSNSNRAPGGPARMFAAFEARPEACKALSLGLRAARRPPEVASTRRGQKNPLFFQRRRKSRFSTIAEGGWDLRESPA